MFKFKSIYTKIKSIFKTHQAVNPVVLYNGQNTLVNKNNNSQKFSSQINVHELRGKIIRDEYISETAGIEANTLNIVESADEITYSRQIQALTANGLETDNHEFLIRTAEGYLVKASELHHGGKCKICNRLSDGQHFRHCSVCQAPLCSSCSKKFKELILCPTHYKHAVFHNNTWDEGEYYGK